MTSKIIKGMKEALNHSMCANRHRESHVTTKTADREYTVECSRCGHSWIEESRYDGLEAIRVVKPRESGSKNRIR